MKTAFFLIASLLLAACRPVVRNDLPSDREHYSAPRFEVTLPQGWRESFRSDIWEASVRRYVHIPTDMTLEVSALRLSGSPAEALAGAVIRNVRTTKGRVWDAPDILPSSMTGDLNALRCGSRTVADRFAQRGVELLAFTPPSIPETTPDLTVLLDLRWGIPRNLPLNEYTLNHRPPVVVETLRTVAHSFRLLPDATP